MNLLIVDPQGGALDTAWRARLDGHAVRMLIRDTPKTCWIGKGMVPVIRDAATSWNWADLIFLADNTRWLREVDAQRPAHAIVGPTQELAQWELDRQVGQDILRKHGVPVAPSVEFSNYDKAIAFVKSHPRRWVSKPSGDADKALSYCSNSAADMVYMLDKWKRAGLRKDFLLQEFIDGCEMAVGAWHGPNGWATPWCENFEFKKMMDGDKGVTTGEQGTVMRYVARSKLADQVLAPLSDTLGAHEYVGYIDVNCIIDDAGKVWPLEFTMRPGWPTTNIQYELHPGDSVRWLKDLADGEKPPVIEDKIAIGVVLSIPDYPYSHLTRKEVVGAPVYGAMAPRLAQHVHFCEMMWGEAPFEDGGNIVDVPMPVTAGDYVLVMSALGDSVYEAKQTAYRRLKKIQTPNSPMYRTDIGDRLARQLPMLQKHGFARGMAFSAD